MTRTLIWLWVCATLAACAAGGRVGPESTDTGSGNEQGLAFAEASTPQPDGQPPHQESGVNPGLEQGVAQPDTLGAVDHDGDGHCAPGAADPLGKCKGFSDCDDNDKARYPGAPETCADVGVDNDCDNDSQEVDLDGDGVSDLGTQCKKGLPGICDQGSRHCKQGQLVCMGKFAVGQVKESCNGQDDDCDGSKDNGQLCADGHTCGGKVGCRCKGAAACGAGQGCCASGCKQLNSDTSNCGACGSQCGPGEACSSGRCRCGSTYGPPGGGPACTGSSCTGNSCTTCSSSKNLATQASASSTGGGSSAKGYGPELMNDGTLQSTCKFHWINAGSSLSGGKWLRYSWPSAVTIGRVWFDTAPLAKTCTSGGTGGRTLAGGQLQYLSGGKWKTVGIITSRTSDWSYSFNKVTTTQLRLYHAHATSAAGQKSNPMIFEWRVFCK